MTSFVLWVLLPGLSAGLLYGLRRWQRATTLAGVGIALLLAWLAWQFPIGESIPVRLWAGLAPARIQPEHTLFGSRFTLDNPARPALALLYLSAAFWFGGAGAARTHRLFVPLGLAAVALICAALGAEAIPAAALLLGLAALLCIPIVSSPGEATRRGAVRLLVYVVCGICLVLFADAALTTGLAPTLQGAPQATPETARDTTSALLILALGFAMILAVVPFHTWMPMLGEETNPYTAAFIFFLLPMAASFLALETLTRYSVAGATPAMFIVVRYAGALMAITGGVGAALERNLGRILAFAAIVMLGMMLIAISLNDQLGRPTALIGLFFAVLAPTGLGLGIWGLALTILSGYVPDLSYRSVRGVARRLPTAAAVLLLANLSLAGMPLLAGFPVHLALWSALAQRSHPTALLASLGAAGLGIAALRTLAVMARLDPSERPQTLSAEAPAGVTGPGPATLPASAPPPAPAAPAIQGPRWQMTETRWQAILLAAGGLLLFLAGCFPQSYLPTLASMAILFAGPIP
jgi:NADH:ubiquinone oxidoreductase subunit 2 (subunit N)